MTTKTKINNDFSRFVLTNTFGLCNSDFCLIYNSFILMTLLKIFHIFLFYSLKYYISFPFLCFHPTSSMTPNPLKLRASFCLIAIIINTYESVHIRI